MFNPTSQPGPGDLFFRIGPFPIRIMPMFWIVGLLLGINAVDDAMQLMAWILAFFVAILVHELGHAIMMRYYGDWPKIMLYGFGGMAFCDEPYPRWNTTWQRNVVTCFAGPAAGFLLVAAICGASILAGSPILVVWSSLRVIVFAKLVMTGQMLFLWYFLNDLMLLCVFWGIINLAPIWPLDGGRISRSLLERFSPRTGTMRAFQVSLIFAVFLAVWFGMRQSIWGAVLFGMLAFQSFQVLTSLSARRY